MGKRVTFCMTTPDVEDARYHDVMEEGSNQETGNSKGGSSINCENLDLDGKANVNREMITGEEV